MQDHVLKEALVFSHIIIKKILLRIRDFWFVNTYYDLKKRKTGFI